MGATVKYIIDTVNVTLFILVSINVWSGNQSHRRKTKNLTNTEIVVPPHDIVAQGHDVALL